VADREGQEACSLEHLQGRRAALQNAVQALDVAIDRLEHGDNREPGEACDMEENQSTYFDNGSKAFERDWSNGFRKILTRDQVPWDEAAELLNADGIVDQDVQYKLIEAWIDGFMKAQEEKHGAK